uniref:Uncharacterized protein n=1 Tax=Daphnia galeata TaxID=27404 RepID=A0A8J2RSB5_9CRUS|nr:unnamed protein product [Daphnia galeata]
MSEPNPSYVTAITGSAGLKYKYGRKRRVYTAEPIWSQPCLEQKLDSSQSTTYLLLPAQWSYDG